MRDASGVTGQSRLLSSSPRQLHSHIPSDEHPHPADRVFPEGRGVRHHLSCTPHGPMAPGGEADRGSRCGWRAAGNPGRDTAMASASLACIRGQVPDPGMSSRMAGRQPWIIRRPGPVRLPGPGNVMAGLAGCGSDHRHGGYPERPHRAPASR